MIDINLLDYKQELKKIAMQKIIINATGLVLFLIFLIVTYWCFQKIEIKYRANELKQLEGQVRKLTTQTTKIQSMKLQAKRTAKIIKKINELRANQFQVTQILEDLILPVPDEIWLTSVRQLGIKEIKRKKIPLIFIGDPKQIKTKKKSNKSKKKIQPKQEFLEVRGRLFGKHSDETIVRYIDRLRDSSSFDKVFLHQTSQQENKTEAVRDFTFYVYMPMKA
jgi:Tfp pilus assembly protein PilN